MKRAPIFQKDENGSTNELEYYDPQNDFTKFMEEARKHANDLKHQVGPHENSTAVVGSRERDQKIKKSWKDCVFFWRRYSKKETTESNHEMRPNHSPISGPLPRNRSAIVSRRISRPTSGPIAGWFTPSRAEETRLPYMCLEQESCIANGKVFGPIYRVT